MQDQYPGWSPYVYTADNPMGFIDPDGQGLWDIICGAANSIADNNTLGLTKARENANYEDAGDGRLGEKIGDVLSVAQSAIETTLGTSNVIAGGGAEVIGPATGPGELVLAPAGMGLIGIGAAATAHGTTVGVSAVSDFMKDGNQQSGGQQKGTRVNPDGTSKSSKEQLEQIEKAQKKVREGKSNKK